MSMTASLSYLVKGLWKPQYVLRPSQLVRLLRAEFGTPVGMVRLPWGHEIACDPEEEIGRGLTRLGVYDLPVTEVVYRLAEPGEIVVDAGANIGYMTSLLLYRVGRGGSVLAFEPHPEIVEALRANVARWPGTVTVSATALSDHEGTEMIVMGANFAQNRGTAHIATAASGEQTHPVAVTTIDSALSNARVSQVGVMKVDVEGHELALMRGAYDSLAAHRIRDVVFEDHHSMPSEALTLLRSAGYTVFGITGSFLGPKLISPEAMNHRREWEPGNYLATTDPVRAQRHVAPRGWQTLQRPERRPRA